MKKILDNISLKFGLTPIELKSVLFIVVVFLVGNVAKYYKISLGEKPIKQFDYSFQDSLFKALNEAKNLEQNLNKKSEKRVDSEVELYDFSTNKLDSKKKSNNQLIENSINLNSADINTLTKLPGIGIKTAEKIIELRNKKNGFSNINELTEVKGIGLKKFEKIKKYLILE